MNPAASGNRPSRQQVVLRAVVTLAGWGVLGTAALAGTQFPWLFAAPGVVLAVLAGLLPDTGVALFLVLDLLLVWGVAVPLRIDLPLLAAALLVLALHLAATLAAGPPGAVLPASVVRRWGLRGVTLAAGTTLAWLVARVAAGASLTGTAATMAAGLLLVIGWCVLLTVRLAVAGGDAG